MRRRRRRLGVSDGELLHKPVISTSGHCWGRADTSMKKEKSVSHILNICYESNGLFCGKGGARGKIVPLQTCFDTKAYLTYSDYEWVSMINE